MCVCVLCVCVCVCVCVCDCLSVCVCVCVCVCACVYRVRNKFFKLHGQMSAQNVFCVVIFKKWTAILYFKSAIVKTKHECTN